MLKTVLNYLYNQIVLGITPKYLVSLHYRNPAEYCKPLRETNKPLGFGDRYGLKTPLPLRKLRCRIHSQLPKIFHPMSASIPKISRKIKFISLKKTDILWFDGRANVAVKGLLKKYQALHLDPRNNIYFTPLSFFLSIPLVLRYGKIGIYIALIKCINPRLLITCIHNNHTYWRLSSMMPEYRFLIVQNSYQPFVHDRDKVPSIFGSINFNEFKYNSPLIFLSYSDFCSKIFKKAGASVCKFHAIGSVKLAYAMRKYQHLSTRKNTLCLIADGTCDQPYYQRLLSLLSDYLTVTPFESFAIALKVSADSPNYLHTINSIQDYFHFPVSFIPNDFTNLSSYRAIIESELVIGTISSLLLEAFSTKKKVISFDFTECLDLALPLPDICICRESSRELFHKKLNDMRNLAQFDYEQIIDQGQSDGLPIIDSSNSLRVFKNLLDQYLNQP